MKPESRMNGPDSASEGESEAKEEGRESGDCPVFPGNPGSWYWEPALFGQHVVLGTGDGLIWGRGGPWYRELLVTWFRELVPRGFRNHAPW